MTAGHVFYIPLSILVGLILGYFWGRRAEEKESSRHSDRDDGRARRKRRRRQESDGD